MVIYIWGRRLSAQVLKMPTDCMLNKTIQRKSNESVAQEVDRVEERSPRNLFKMASSRDLRIYAR